MSTKQSDLFRQQAMQHHRQRLHGAIVLWRPASFAAITFGACAVCVAVLAFLCIGSINRTEQASGVLRLDRRLAGDELQAQLNVPHRAMSLVQVGTSVSLRYAAYPYQRFGVHSGQVVAIDSGTGADTATSRVWVRLQSPTLQANGTTHVLQPGLQVDATLLLERRRLIEWILEPFRQTTAQDQSE